MYKSLRDVINLRIQIVHHTDEFNEQVIQNLKDACNKMVDLEKKLNEVV